MNVLEWDFCRDFDAGFPRETGKSNESETGTRNAKVNASLTENVRETPNGILTETETETVTVTVTVTETVIQTETVTAIANIGVQNGGTFYGGNGVKTCGESNKHENDDHHMDG